MAELIKKYAGLSYCIMSKESESVIEEEVGAWKTKLQVSLQYAIFHQHGVPLSQFFH
jgi:hypothetical protein